MCYERNTSLVSLLFLNFEYFVHSFTHLYKRSICIIQLVKSETFTKNPSIKHNSVINTCLFSFLVKMTREAAIDAQLVCIVANMAKQRAQTLHTDLVVFEPLEFAQKLVNTLNYVLIIVYYACSNIL